MKVLRNIPQQPIQNNKTNAKRICLHSSSFIMGQGSIRNKPCPCGSGKKLKNCHGSNQEENKLEIWKVDQKIRDSHNKIKKCMASAIMKKDCSSEIVKAHSVSKTTNLKLIARNGHVYSYFISSLNELDKTGGKIDSLKLIGINKASTFSGFCKNHDNEIFRPLESKTFIGSVEQLLLLAYRGLVQELYKKEANILLFDEELEALLDITKYSDGRERKNEQMIGTNLAISDLNRILETYTTTLYTKSYSRNDYIYYIMYTDQVPPIMMSSCLFPELDYKGNKLQDLADINTKCDEITLHAISTKSNEGAFIFFSRRTKIAEAFISSFSEIPNKHKLTTFLKLTFIVSENIFIAPDWWDSLPYVIQKGLLEGINLNTLESQPYRHKESGPIAGFDVSLSHISTNLKDNAL